VSLFDQRASNEIVFVNGAKISETAGPRIIGSRSFDASRLPQEGLTFNWEVSLAVSLGSIFAQIQLYNLTAGGVVAGSQLQTALTTAQNLSAVITLPLSLQEYEVRLNISSQPASEFATSWYAAIRPTWV